MRLQNGNSHWSARIPWWGLIEKRLTTVFASYRPELHYMRGPGPKWREKHPSGLDRPITGGPLVVRPTGGITGSCHHPVGARGQ
jgi:hypothetical protein